MPAPKDTPPQSITQRGIDSITDLAEQQVRGGLEDFGRALTDLPAFLAGPTPQSAAALPLYGIVRQACRTYARGFGPQNLPGFDSVWGGLCEPFLEDIGEEPTPGTIGNPAPGGQCPGVVYRLNWSWSAGSFNSGPQTADRVGPLSFDYSETGSLPCGSGPERYNVLRVVDGTGASPVGIYAGCGAALNSFTITPLNGASDNCGSAPPAYDPPKVKPGLPTLPPAPIDFPGIGPVNVDVTFGPDGEIIIDFPDIGTDVTIDNPFGDAPSGGGGGDGPSTPGTPGTPSNTGAGGEDEGAAGDGEELVGLLVEVLATPENPNTFDNVAQTVYRGIGYVRMGYAGRLGLDISGGTVLAPQFFHAQQRGLTHWAVRANNGFNLRTTPYYREIPS